MRLKGSICWVSMLVMIVINTMPCFAQTAVEGHSIIPPGSKGATLYSFINHSVIFGKQNSFMPAKPPNISKIEVDTLVKKTERKTTSLMAGYIADEFSIESNDGTYRFRFNGETTGLMLGSKSSSLMFSYGLANAVENEGDIRSITADLNLGGNITIFRRFLGLPIGSFIPIRVNLGYRNLEILDSPNSDLNNTANIGMGNLGAGLGTEIRIPTGLPVLKDNLTAFAHLVTSFGAIRDFTSAGNGVQSDGKALSGIRLTKSTDFTFEAKFERLLGNKTGVTAGLTLRWLHWTREEAEDVKQILDVISGEQEGLELRATQSFFRVGINW